MNICKHLHALAITTGVEKFGGPSLISVSVPGKGAGAANGQVAFNPLKENPRAALLLANGAVYLTWASSCDVGPYHGWVMAYDSQTLAQKAVLNVNPDGSQGRHFGPATPGLPPTLKAMSTYPQGTAPSMPPPAAATMATQC